MNILYVSHFSHGVNVSPILNIAHLLANRGHNVHFYTVKTSYIKFREKDVKMAEIPKNVHMHYINNYFLIKSVAYPFINPLNEYYDLKNLIKEHNIDLIHFIFPEFLTCLPLLRKTSLGVPTVLSINGIPGYDWFYNNRIIDSIGKIYSRFISSRIIKNCDIAIISSSKIKKTLDNLDIDVNLKKVTDYGGYYGVDTDLFKPVDIDEKNRLREKYGLRKGSFIIIYAGRFAKVKRLELIIKSFKKLNYCLQGSFLLLVGDGPTKRELVKLADNRSNIKFMDFVDQKVLSELYNSSDMFILLSGGEGNAVSVMEALSSGLPVLGSNVGAVSDIIRIGLNGHLIEDINVEKVVDLIVLINRKHEELSKNARIYALKEFSWDSIITKYEKIYTNLINEEK